MQDLLIRGAWVHDGLQPDLTLVFDVPVEVARERLRKAGTPDRFESEDVAFFNRVRAAYQARARQDPGRVRIVDSSGTLDQARKSLEDIVSTI